jgi:N-acyl homoserine lactone hydrolase
MHQDHIGGLRYFPQAKILVSRREYKTAQTFSGGLQGHMPKNWPGWFNPQLIDYSDDSFGTFPESFTLTKAGDVHLVATEGHSTGHLSVILEVNGLSFFFAGDVSFNQQFLLTKTVAGVSASVQKNRQTLEGINQYVTQNPTVYLPSHDPEAANRLVSRTTVC